MMSLHAEKVARLFRALVEAEERLRDAKVKAADVLTVVHLAETERQNVIDALSAVWREVES